MNFFFYFFIFKSKVEEPLISLSLTVLTPAIITRQFRWTPLQGENFTGHGSNFNKARSSLHFFWVFPLSFDAQRPLCLASFFGYLILFIFSFPEQKSCLEKRKDFAWITYLFLKKKKFLTLNKKSFNFESKMVFGCVKHFPFLE